MLHDWPWKAPGHLYDAGKAAAAGAVDEARAVAAFAEYAALEAKALALQIASDVAHAAAKTAALAAKGADKAAQIAGKVADAAGRTAQTLEAVAARDSAQASSADSAFKSLAAAYARQEAHKLAKIAKATVRALKKAGHAVARAAKAVAKAACKYSGAQDVVGCVTHPSLAGCAKAALTVALTVGTAGEGEIAEIGLNAAEHAGEDIAENAGTHAAEEAGGDAAVGSGTGGALRLVIGRVADLRAPGAIGPDEYTLLDKLTPSLSSARANWYKNAGVLRAELSRGLTQIRDASPGDTGGQFLNAERNLLKNRGWNFEPVTNIWHAP